LRIAFLYTIDNGLTPLGTLPGGSNSEAFAVNRSTDSVGDSDTTGDSHRPVLFSNQTARDLGIESNAATILETAYGINDSGQIVGRYQNADGATHAFLYVTGQLTDLGTLGGANSEALALNVTGLIVGDSQTSAGPIHAFVFNNGAMQDLGTLPDFANASFARGVNNAGQIVGESDSESQKRAFVYSDGRMTDLTLAAVNMRQAGFSALDVANSVNNQGWIAGFGTTLDGRLAGFLAIPVGVTSDPPGGPDAPTFTSGDLHSAVWTGGWFAPVGLWSVPIAGGALYWSQYWHGWPRAPWHIPPQKPHWQPPCNPPKWPAPRPKPNPNGTPNQSPNPRGTPNQFPGVTPRPTPTPNPGMTPRPPWLGGTPSPNPSGTPNLHPVQTPTPSGTPKTSPTPRQRPTPSGSPSNPTGTPNPTPPYVPQPSPSGSPQGGQALHLPTPKPSPSLSQLPANARSFRDLSRPDNPYAAGTPQQGLKNGIGTPTPRPSEIATNPNNPSRHQTVESQEAAKANATPTPAYHRPGDGRGAQVQGNKTVGAGVKPLVKEPIKSGPEPNTRIEHHTGAKTGSSGASHSTSHNVSANRPKPAVNKPKPAPSKPRPTPKKR
jgi:probable HAF family extracellular repeat protein